MRPGTRSSLKREDGAAAVEFAIIVSLLFVVIFGIMEYGVAFLQMQTLRSAAREGSRTAAVRGDESAVRNSLVDASNGLLPAGFDGFSVSPGLCTDVPDTSGQEVTVTLNNDALPESVQQALTINIPFLPPIDLNPTLSGTFRCE